MLVSWQHLFNYSKVKTANSLWVSMHSCLNWLWEKMKGERWKSGLENVWEVWWIPAEMSAFSLTERTAKPCHLVPALWSYQVSIHLQFYSKIVLISLFERGIRDCNPEICLWEGLLREVLKTQCNESNQSLPIKSLHYPHIILLYKMKMNLSESVNKICIGMYTIIDTGTVIKRNMENRGMYSTVDWHVSFIPQCLSGRLRLTQAVAVCCPAPCPRRAPCSALRVTIIWTGTTTTSMFLERFEGARVTLLFHHCAVCLLSASTTVALERWGWVENLQDKKKC